MQFSPDVNQFEVRVKISQIFCLRKNPAVFIQDVFNAIKITNNNFQSIWEEKLQ